MSNSTEIQSRILEVQKRISEAAIRSGRKANEITLLAVTKTFPTPTIQSAYDAGLRQFGENRVQESLEKIETLPNDIQWHLIGQLQTNKINKILGKFKLIHSVDSLHLAQALSVRMGGSIQDILLEVNTSGEVSKAGVSPSEALATAKEILRLPGLSLAGLMTVGPLTEDGEKQRGAFKELKRLFDVLRPDCGPGFSILSMGMSGDFETAIEEGSTLVRVGSAIFGARG
ncbi:MAG TPA: YggS family pyridoxal phosphate-dependent enzyme [bacterium]|nr:YggS family pyridoxal phosphate-dependent enzyme [bacterium]